VNICVNKIINSFTHKNIHEIGNINFFFFIIMLSLVFKNKSDNVCSSKKIETPSTITTYTHPVIENVSKDLNQ